MKEKIVFTEDLAKQVLERFPSLDEKTLRVWKTRGTIPNQYFEGYDDSPKIQDSDPLYPKFKEIMLMREIAPSYFRTFHKRPKKCYDIQNGKDRMTEAEKLTFMTEVSEIRNKLMRAYKVTNEANLKDVIKDKRLHYTTLVPSKIKDRLASNFFIEPQEKKDLQATLILFYNRLLLVPDTKQI